MYNEDQKERYIKTCKYPNTTRELIRHCFNSSEIVEDSYEKDLCFFKQSEVVDLLNSFGRVQKGTLIVKFNHFADYYKWCYVQGIVSDVENRFDYAHMNLLIDSVATKEMFEEKYFSKETLVNEYLPKIDDVSNKLLLYGSYLSLKSDNESPEIQNLKMKDLNEEEKTVSLITKRIVKVDDLFIDLMKRTNESLEYIPDKTALSTAQYLLAYHPDSPYVLKQQVRGKPEPLSTGIIMKRFQLIKRQTENRFLTRPTIFKNGLINFIKEKYEEDDITLKSVFTSKINGVKHEYEDRTQGYIEEFGFPVMQMKQIRYEILEYLDKFE